MGATYMDYLIADRVVVPSAQQMHYSEKIVHLPGTFFPIDSMRKADAQTPSREKLGLPSTGFVFCCFNNNYKITPEVFGAWMRILNRVDAAVIWLSPNNPEAAANLRNAASRLGVDPGRLIFADRVASLPHHLARYRTADLFLDTLPYNAHATAVDALSSGLPVLTCLGDGFAGRVAASLLDALGLKDLVTETIEGYEELAVVLACEPGRLARLKDRLAAHPRTTAPFDVRRYTRHLEAGYIMALDRLLSKLPPDHLYVDSHEN
jgi:predicted O-linked N-acetylglucosamine transferase (SPINDLY family)